LRLRADSRSPARASAVRSFSSLRVLSGLLWRCDSALSFEEYRAAANGISPQNPPDARAE